MGIKTVKAIELIPDWNIWPRYGVNALDHTNVERMKKGLRAGYVLPHVVAAMDYRLIDGFHRTKAMLSVFGDDVKIKVEFREYKNDGEMLVDAASLNASQGLPMNQKDRAHFILKARRLKAPWPGVAEALHMDVEEVKTFLESRTATTKGGEKIALPYGAKSLAGKTLTPAQEHYAQTANGTIPEMYISMLLNALRSDSLIITEQIAKRLKELRQEIDMVIKESVI